MMKHHQQVREELTFDEERVGAPVTSRAEV